MADSCSTDHNCKFNNNIVLMFQDINVAKSAPFALLLYTKNPCIPPFLYLDHEEWKPQISQQIAQNSLNSPITTTNDAKST